MPPSVKRKALADGYSSSTGYYSYDASAFLRALDEPKAKGKKNVKVAEIGGIIDAGKPKPKKARKDGDFEAPPAPEKRERAERVISQRFFMIERKRNGEELREEFRVLGSTANVYHVTIDKRPSCTCPDAEKGNHCKHILFIFMKVLQVPQCSSHWYQKALLTSELEEIFREAPPAPSAIAGAKVRNAYEQATGGVSSHASSSTNAEKNRRKIGAEDDCAVCYEGMADAPESTLSWCESCGNALHKECFQQWAKRKGTKLDCVYCRAPWTGAGAPESTPHAGAAITRGGYINLAGPAGVSPVRDTSTYYQGPRRGQRYYGYQDYDDY